MPKTEVVFFAVERGTSPVLDWLDKQPDQVQDKCMARIELLENMGHKLDRPAAAKLEANLYELRARHVGTEYRILYFFDDDGRAVLTSAFVKKTQKVPVKEKAAAKERRGKYLKDPYKHTFEE